MSVFSTGDSVRITGPTMTGNIGTVIHHDAGHGLYLVRVDAVTQNYFQATDLEYFTP